MYELKGGTERLSAALDTITGNAERLNTIAETLYYDPEQLRQDISALRDFIRMAEAGTLPQTEISRPENQSLTEDEEAENMDEYINGTDNEPQDNEVEEEQQSFFAPIPLEGSNR